MLCILEWGKVSSQCPLCKTTFQQVCGKYNPNLFQVISPKLKNAEDENFDFEYAAGSDDGYDAEYGEVLDEEYGYELDGFVVSDDFVEFE
jgi:hypothetical protein